MADDVPTISTSRIPASEVARRSFGVTRRGFDPEEVRAFLEVVSRELLAAERREQELLHDLAEAEERARHPVVDEAVLTSALGQRSAAVLRNAHEEAARIRQQAEEAAVSRSHDAQQQATETAVQAESTAAERIAEAELSANALRQQTQEEAAALLEATRAEGEALVERAREHGRAMVEQAQEARRRVLADMGHRRRAVTDQIEQFRAARDEVAASVLGVRQSLDRIVDDLGRADDAARAAAAEAARHQGAVVPEAVLVAEAEQAAAELGLDTGAHPLGSTGAVAEDVDDTPRGAVLRFDDVGPGVHEPPSAGPAGLGDEDEPTAIVRLGQEAERPERDSAVPEGRVYAVRPAETAVGPDGEPGVAVDELVEVDEDARAIDGTPAEGSAEPEAADAPVPATEPAPAGDVEGLFARLRAQRAATAESTEPPPEEKITGEVPAVTLEVVPSEAEPNGPAESPSEPAGAVTEEAEEPEESDADHAALVRRGEVLGPIVTTMTRRLKRALQDDQNRLLDRLRKGTGEWSDDLLVDEALQRAFYAKASAVPLRDATVAGIAFGRAASGHRHGRAPAPDPQTVEAVTDELVGSVVTLLRRRLEGGDVPDAAERIGAAYREWRGERIERLAEDRAIEAFSVGVVTGAGQGVPLRWVRSDTGPGCADCEDNALAEGTAPGEEFPTGHRYPPAHAGCRCLVLPTPA